jgi:hypothetical protein
MLIASKYEEIYAPEVRDFVYITDKAYSKEEILRMEHKILGCLNFEVTHPSAFRQVERYTKLASNEDQFVNLARYLIELPLIEYKMLRYTPSMIAAAAVYLTMKILKRDSPWNDHLKEETQYNEQQVRPCAKDLCILLQGIEKCSLQAVRKKFSLPKFNEVALIKIDN